MRGGRALVIGLWASQSILFRLLYETEREKKISVVSVLSCSNPGAADEPDFTFLTCHAGVRRRRAREGETRLPPRRKSEFLLAILSGILAVIYVGRIANKRK